MKEQLAAAKKRIQDLETQLAAAQALCRSMQPTQPPPVAVDPDTIQNAKHTALELLWANKSNEPLDSAKLQLVLRGYIGALDLIAAVIGS